MLSVRRGENPPPTQATTSCDTVVCRASTPAFFCAADACVAAAVLASVSAVFLSAVAVATSDDAADCTAVSLLFTLATTDVATVTEAPLNVADRSVSLATPLLIALTRSALLVASMLDCRPLAAPPATKNVTVTVTWPRVASSHCPTALLGSQLPSPQICAITLGDQGKRCVAA